MRYFLKLIKENYGENKISRNIFNTIITKGLRNIIGFACSVLISRQLGVVGKGDFAYYMLIFSIIATYGTLGINQGMLYSIKRSNHSRDSIVNTTFTFIILIFIIIVFSLVGLSHFNIIKTNSIIVLAIGFIYILSYFLQDALNLIHIGDEKIRRTNNCFLIAHLTKLILTTIAYYLKGINIVTAIMFEAIDVIVCVILLYLTADIKLRINFNFRLAIKEVKYGIVILGASLCAFMLYRVDQLFIKKYLSSEDLGIYSTAASLCDIIRIIPASIAMNMMGDIYNKKPFSLEAKKSIAKGVKISLYTTIVTTIVTYCALFMIPIIYGSEYKEVVPVMKIMLPGVCFTSIASVAAVYYQSCGKPKVPVLITSSALITEIILCILLINSYGIYGAAYATDMAYLVYGVLYFFMLNKIEKIKIKELLILGTTRLG